MQGYNYAQLVEQHKFRTSQQEAEYQNRQAQLQQLEQQWKPYHVLARIQEQQQQAMAQAQAQQQSQMGQANSVPANNNGVQ